MLIVCLPFLEMHYKLIKMPHRFFFGVFVDYSIKLFYKINISAMLAGGGILHHHQQT